ncbi:MAG: glycoside hydrolase family 2 protein [Thermoprotei archaeon]|nr:MAG: glycoside hydrolase family 2 protein [Thermoprotei archaeon]RLF20616.1 MAG: glycoside hydrolase family 2 protein [Thermoprotei archaeon]
MFSRFRPKIVLEGYWKFKLDPNKKGEEEGWFNGLRTGDLIYVPSSWNEQRPQWDQYMGVAWYENEFFVPKEYDGMRVWLTFEGVSYKAKVWLNGEFLGEHEGAFTQFKLNADKAVKFGDYNKLIVEVDNTLTKKNVPPGEGMNNTYFDFFHYGGIFRPVYVEFTNPDYIEDLTVITDHKGLLKVDITVVGEGRLIVKLTLVDDEGREVYSKSVEVKKGKATIDDHVSGVKPWSPEEPNLYTLRASLIKDNEVKDMVEENIGFRSVAVRNGRLYLNDRPIFLKGVGRHEDFPVTGKYLPGAVLIRDFYLMKELGMNSFRTSHYPYSNAHLDLADKLGFLVILESPMVGAREEHFTDREYIEKVKRMIEEMIKQHKNRPSVIMYSVANEPRSNVETAYDFIKELCDHVKKLDPTRPVTFASMFHTEDKALEAVDVISLNIYLGWYKYPGEIDEGVREAERILDKVHEMYPDKPILITEFGAGAVSGFHHDPPVMWSEEYQAEFIRKYIEMLKRKEYIIGMHIWNFADFRTPQSARRVILNRKGLFTRTRQPKLAVKIVKEEFNKIPTFLE